jgi:carotenoid cleavage dioxygenase-like enzyme
VRWFEAPGQYSYHSANAWAEGEGDTAVLITASAVGFDFGTSNVRSLKLHKWKFDMVSGKTVEDEVLCDLPAEFPVVNPAFIGLKNRFIWSCVLISEPTPLASNGVFKYDIDSGEVIQHTYVGGRRGGEAFFAPRSGPGATGEEDDGYLITFTTVPGASQSDLYIMDARTLAADPIAIIPVGARVPNGFHALFVTGDAVRHDQRSTGLQSVDKFVMGGGSNNSKM